MQLRGCGDLHASEVSSTIDPHRRRTAYAWVVDGAIWRPRRAGTRSRYAHEDLDSAPEKDLTLPRGKKQSHNGLRISRGRPRNDALRAVAASK